MVNWLIFAISFVLVNCAMGAVIKENGTEATTQLVSNHTTGEEVEKEDHKEVTEVEKAVNSSEKLNEIPKEIASSNSDKNETVTELETVTEISENLSTQVPIIENSTNYSSTLSESTTSTSPKETSTEFSKDLKPEVKKKPRKPKLKQKGLFFTIEPELETAETETTKPEITTSTLEPLTTSTSETVPTKPEEVSTEPKINSTEDSLITENMTETQSSTIEPKTEQNQTSESSTEHSKEPITYDNESFSNKTSIEKASEEIANPTILNEEVNATNTDSEGSETQEVSKVTEIPKEVLIETSQATTEAIKPITEVLEESETQTSTQFPDSSTTQFSTPEEATFPTNPVTEDSENQSSPIPKTTESSIQKISRPVHRSTGLHRGDIPAIPPSTTSIPIITISEVMEEESEEVATVHEVLPPETETFRPVNRPPPTKKPGILKRVKNFFKGRLFGRRSEELKAGEHEESSEENENVTSIMCSKSLEKSSK